jgi:hypothetical protein
LAQQKFLFWTSPILAIGKWQGLEFVGP